MRFIWTLFLDFLGFLQSLGRKSDFFFFSVNSRFSFFNRMKAGDRWRMTSPHDALCHGLAAAHDQVVAHGIALACNEFIRRQAKKSRCAVPWLTSRAWEEYFCPHTIIINYSHASSSSPSENCRSRAPSRNLAARTRVSHCSSEKWRSTCAASSRGRRHVLGDPLWVSFIVAFVCFLS